MSAAAAMAYCERQAPHCLQAIGGTGSQSQNTPQGKPMIAVGIRDDPPWLTMCLAWAMAILWR